MISMNDPSKKWTSYKICVYSKDPSLFSEGSYEMTSHTSYYACFKHV